MKHKILLLFILVLLISGCVKLGTCKTYEVRNKCEEEIKDYTNGSLSMYHPNYNEPYHTCCWKELKYNETIGYYSKETCRGFIGEGEDIIEYKRYGVSKLDCYYGTWIE